MLLRMVSHPFLLRMFGGQEDSSTLLYNMNKITSVSTSIDTVDWKMFVMNNFLAIVEIFTVAARRI